MPGLQVLSQLDRDTAAILDDHSIKYMHSPWGAINILGNMLMDNHVISIDCRALSHGVCGFALLRICIAVDIFQDRLAGNQPLINSSMIGLWVCGPSHPLDESPAGLHRVAASWSCPPPHSQAQDKPYRTRYSDQFCGRSS